MTHSKYNTNQMGYINHIELPAMYWYAYAQHVLMLDIQMTSDMHQFHNSIYNINYQDEEDCFVVSFTNKCDSNGLQRISCII